MKSWPPAEVVTRMRQVRMDGMMDPLHCGESGMVMGWWVEAHTIGCYDADEDVYLSIHKKLSDDDLSVVMGDPGEGAFVSATKVDTQYQMGASELIELGAKARKRIPLDKARAIADDVVEDLRPYSDVILVAGSIRRRKEDIGDIDIVVLPNDLEAFLSHMDVAGWSGGERKRVKKESGINVEVHVAHRPEDLGGHLFMYTGDQVFNIAMRSKAKREGWKLNQYGIYDSKTGAVIVESADEREFFDALGVPYHTPEDRSLKDRPKKAAIGSWE